MNDYEQSKRGEDARQLLESELLQEVLSSLDQAYVEAWRKADTFEAREDAHKYVELCAKFHNDLKNIAKGGQMAVHRIKELEGKRPFWRGGL